MSAIGGIKKIVVMEGKEQEFLALFFEMRRVIGQEAGGGVEYYDIYRSREAARGFVVMERWRDTEAWKAHQDADYGKYYFLKIRAILESIEVEYFDMV